MTTPTGGFYRRFLIGEVPGHLPVRHRTRIHLGYILQDENREVRLRVQGADCFLAVREPGAPTSDPVEIPLSRSQFNKLWPLTEGHRLEMLRFTTQVERLPLHIDTFQGDHAPLRMVEARFPTREAADAMENLEFLGEEVTDRMEYRHATLAVQGLPDPAGRQIQIGAFPFLFRRDRLHVVLVTNSSQTKWIVPKGQPEPGMSRPEVALMEAFEEAGLIGEITRGVRGQCSNGKGRQLYIMPLRVSTVLRAWPESHYRKRRILPLDKALKLIDDEALTNCIARLAHRITEEPA